jgi:hypothetical protein
VVYWPAERWPFSFSEVASAAPWPCSKVASNYGF